MVITETNETDGDNDDNSEANTDGESGDKIDNRRESNDNCVKMYTLVL